MDGRHITDINLQRTNNIITNTFQKILPNHMKNKEQKME